jgi:hypothetical protein
MFGRVLIVVVKNLMIVIREVVMVGRLGDRIVMDE